MGLSIAAKNLMLDALAAVAGFASLHTALPNDSGSNEVAGGSPAYARKAHTWNAAASGNLDDSNAPVFDVPAATTVGWFGMWSLASGGTFYGSGLLGAPGDPIPFTAANSGDLFTADAHGYSNGDTVVLIDSGGGAVIPTGVSEGTIYYVVSVSGDTFQLSATLGGSAITISSDGGGFVSKIVTETFSGQGTYTLTDADVALLA